MKAVLHRYETGPPKSSFFGGKEKKSGLVESSNVKFSRELVHRRLGRENISTFNVRPLSHLPVVSLTFPTLVEG